MIYVNRSAISVLLSAGFLCGQSLQVSPSRTDLKAPGIFSVSLESPPGKTPVALQWEFSVPAVIEVTTADITIAKAAESARKSLTCAARSAKLAAQRSVRYACMLAGGRDPIGNGPIVVVRYRAQWDPKGAPIRVVIENILGASEDLKRIPIPDVNVTINMQ
jgi:hypothetical protein